MNRYSIYIFLFAACLVVTLPALGLGVLSYFTNNPYPRPLAITREKLAGIEGQTQFISIFVYVDWGRERTGGATKADLSQMISNTLEFRTSDYVLKFKEVPGDGIDVTFVVGPNRYGPYPPGRMIEGIVLALAALDMTKKASGRA
jgi:hypothetical protein